MPRYKKAYGWKDKVSGKFCLSTLPRESAGAFNVYDTPTQALRDASVRQMTITWENPADIDGK